MYKTDAQNISDFLHKVIVSYRLKIDFSGFFGKDIVLGQKIPEWAQCKGFKFYQKLMPGIFLNFSASYISIKSYN